MCLSSFRALGKTTNTTGQISEARLSGDEIRLRQQSADSWTDVAAEHPEFFRVAGKSEDAIMLVSQYISREKPTDVMLAKLMDIAVTTHDREVERFQRSQERELKFHKLGLTRLSLVLSAITSIGSIIIAIVALVIRKG